MDRLRTFDEQHIREDLRDITGVHPNGLFYGCEFDKLNGLTLQDCDLNKSRFLTNHVRDALGFTLTLSCLSFRNVEYSELLFDLMLTLLTLSSGNDEKREQLKAVIGHEPYAALSRLLKETE